MRQVIGLLVLLSLVLILLLALLHLVARLHVNRFLQNLVEDLAFMLFERHTVFTDVIFNLVLFVPLFFLGLIFGIANALVALEFHVEDLLLLLLFLRFLIFVLSDVVHLSVGVANEVRPDIRVGFGRDLALLVVVENCNFSLLVL